LLIRIEGRASIEAQGLSEIDLIRTQTEYPDLDIIRQVDLASIRKFVATNAHLMTGRVLDFGAGVPVSCRKPQPYRELLTAAEEYVPYDIAGPMPVIDSLFDSVLCTQVFQYLGDGGAAQLRSFPITRHGSTLLLTYATNWDECEDSDLMRCTKAGMEAMLLDAGFQVLVHERRATVKVGNFSFPLGYGVVCLGRQSSGRKFKHRVD